jgi:predicted nucleic acid-binding Zn ribbon protein
MATYEYICPSEGFKSIIVRPISEDEQDYFCGSCGNKLSRVYTAPPVKFNATGFYSTGG